MKHTQRLENYQIRVAINLAQIHAERFIEQGSFSKVADEQLEELELVSELIQDEERKDVFKALYCTSKAEALETDILKVKYKAIEKSERNNLIQTVIVIIIGSTILMRIFGLI
ncbi:hypothetical protein [Pseudoalteromonas maricaloris]|uniref:hypothetical protein n=1 Tax=Pseudoalteromonas maricaloris TaxID=184924 RepID=UPI00029A7B1D|nr:hypothetical protein [Pseudoalteromonas flavipulchra]